MNLVAQATEFPVHQAPIWMATPLFFLLLVGAILAVVALRIVGKLGSASPRQTGADALGRVAPGGSQSLAFMLGLGVAACVAVLYIRTYRSAAPGFVADPPVASIAYGDGTPWLPAYVNEAPKPPIQLNGAKVSQPSLATPPSTSLSSDVQSIDVAAEVDSVEDLEQLEAIASEPAGEVSGEEAVDLAADVSTPPQESPAARPDWVDAPPKMIGDKERLVVQSGPYSTVEQCMKEMWGPLNMAVHRIIEEMHEPQSELWGGGVPSAVGLGITREYVLRELCVDQFVETQVASFGEMKRLYLLLEVGQTHRQYIREMLNQHYRDDRVFVVATAGGGVLASLGALLSLLKFDAWTRGYYSKRLFIGGPVAIIALVLATLLVA
ncbi:MAG: hypothetical protein KDA61_22995 [Planctomycetales bacterium]|nr:hypothetical protein [Planctomycetales bacterium]